MRTYFSVIGVLVVVVGLVVIPPLSFALDTKQDLSAVSASSLATRVVTVDVSGFGLSPSDEKGIADAIGRVMKKQSIKVLDTDNYEVLSINLRDDYGFASIGASDVSTAGRESGAVGGHLAIVKKGKAGQWDAALRYTKDFERLVSIAPDTFLDPESKAFWSSHNKAKSPIVGDNTVMMTAGEVAAEGDQTVNYKMPWPEGLSREIWNDKEWHECGSFGCGIDLGIVTTNPEERTVLASAKGRISYVCDKFKYVAPDYETYPETGYPKDKEGQDLIGYPEDYDWTVNVGIEDADDRNVYYYHLLKSSTVIPASGYWQVNDPVEQGQILGQTKTDDFTRNYDAGMDGCGTATQGVNNSHIHWSIPADKMLAIEDLTIQWSDEMHPVGDPPVNIPTIFKFNGEPYDGPFGSTNSPFNVTPITADHCVLPENRWGDWEISSTCMMNRGENIWGNVRVTNNSMLIIPAGKFLGVALGSQSIRVEPGSTIRIEPGGKILDITDR